MKICLDPGHGEGYNPSPCGFGYAEGTRMYLFALALKEELETYKGVEVVMTRQNIKQSPSLYERAAAGKDCDLLLSLHTNAAGNGVVNGTDYVAVFYPVSGDGKDLARDMSAAISREIATRQAPQTLSKWNSTHTGDYYGIIRNAAMFGVRCLLLEHSFHTDTSTTRWFMDDNNLVDLASVEAEVIAKHYNLIKEDREMRYMTFGDVKSDKYNGALYSNTLQKLIDKGIFSGRGGEGDDRIIDLGEDAIRLLVVLENAKLFD